MSIYKACNAHKSRRTCGGADTWKWKCFFVFFVNVEDGRTASRRERRVVTEGKKARTDPELPDHFLSLVL